MFNRFTERARKIIILAKEEARRFNHDYIGTEHMLLGLIREGEGVAAAVLQKMDVSFAANISNACQTFLKYECPVSSAILRGE